MSRKKRPSAPRGLGALEPEELAALADWCRENGRTWRLDLGLAWMRAATPGALHRVRNRLGPPWLETVTDAEVERLLADDREARDRLGSSDLLDRRPDSV